MSSRLAIITPSYGPDFELCRTLNRSVLEFLPSSVLHYIFVDRRDLKRFGALKGERTIVASKEEIMPRGIVQLPGLNRWISRATLLPISGWLVQQIAKIATAELLHEPTLVMVDSDALFVRYRCPGAITADMESHILWHNNACRILDVRPDPLPMDDYVGQVISWDRAIVRAMCTHLESIGGCSWDTVLARTRAVSEYLLYGLFVEKIIGQADHVWIDERSRCKTHWEFVPLLHSQLADFATSLQDDDFALMISSHSGTSTETRQAAISLATNGRLS
jgi:hypothetical protein